MAAFIVVLAHARHLVFTKYSELEASSQGPLTAIFYVITKLGNEAVLVFFVLSGFLVGGKGIERLKQNRFDIKQYSIDRFTRIIVPLVPAICLTAAMDYYLFGVVNGLHVAGNLFSLQGVFVPQLEGNEALWTLSYEVWFYIILVGIGFLSLHRVLGVLVLLVCAAIFMELQPHYLICWMLGIAAYLWRPKKLSVYSMICSLILLLYGLIGRQMGRGTEFIEANMVQFYLPSQEISRVIFSCGVALIIQQLILINPNRKLVKLESLGTILATFSYTLYLTHFPVIRYFQYEKNVTGISIINVESIFQFVLVISATIITSLVMYLLFERNTDKVRKWMKTKILKQTIEK